MNKIKSKVKTNMSYKVKTNKVSHAHQMLIIKSRHQMLIIKSRHQMLIIKSRVTVALRHLRAPTRHVDAR